MAKGFGVNAYGLQYRGVVKEPPDDDQIQTCMDWIVENAVKTLGVRRDVSSYTWKHIIEKATGFYISNGAFIEAARRWGLRLTPTHEGSVNCYVNMKQLSRDQALVGSPRS